jgi:hypothetical protein
LSITSLKKQIVQLEKQRFNISDTIPELVAAKRKVEDARKEYNEIHTKCTSILSDKHEEICAKITQLQNELQLLQKKKTENIPQEILDWLHKEYCHDMYLGGHPQDVAFISWLSDDHKFAIVTIKGSMQYSGRHLGSSYVSTTHRVVEVFKNKLGLSGNVARVAPIISGRLTIKAKNQLIDTLNVYRKEYNI